MTPFSLISLVAIVAVGQCPELDVYRTELLPLIEQTHVQATRAAAIEGLISIAEDRNRCYSTRHDAIAALPECVPSDVQRRLKKIAESTEEPNEDMLAYEWSGPQILADVATVAYWQIEVVRLGTPEAKRDLWLRILRKENPPPSSRSLLGCAIFALIDFGDKDLLPELLEAISFRNGNEGYGKDLQWFAKAVVDFSQQHASRFDALGAALQADDPTRDRLFERWAVSGLAALGTPEAFDALVQRACRLQEESYDENGQLIPLPDGVRSDDGMTYLCIIGTLREHGWTEEELDSVGIFPGKFFLIID